MCKECGEVVGAEDNENGICKTCIEGGIKVEPIIKNNVDKTILLVNFDKPFSFKNRSGRLDYLVYGLLVPFAIIGLSYIVGIELKSTVVLLGGMLVGAFFAIAATVRRARDRKENIILIIILSVMFSIIASLYLVLAPSRYNKV